ncbi:MAG: replicative DNA helicase [Mycoplasma sp.]|nr:replicative DNA helicase [Mycoplasma sp.]
MSKHHSLEIEKSILGSLIIDAKHLDRLLIVMNENQFYFNSNKIIFTAIKDIHESGKIVEPALIISRLQRLGQFEKLGGKDYINNLLNSAALPKNFNSLVKELDELYKLRNFDKVLGNLSNDIKKPNISTMDFLTRAEEEIFEATRDTSPTKILNSKEVIEETIKKLEGRASGQIANGIATEFEQLDTLLGGMHNGDLVILAARPSMGKTAFALNLAMNIAKKSNVAFFSLEMPAEQLMTRVLASTSIINLSKINKSQTLTEGDWRKIYFARKEISKMNLFIDDSPSLTLAELLWKARKLKQNQKIDMILIDYMQLINHSTGKENNRQAEVSAISRSLKQLARELKVPVIALSQLSRKVEQRENKTPMMSDLRESGAIEQDADLIVFLYREDYYNKKDQQREVQQVEIIVSKHRNGPTGIVKLNFTPSYGLFTDDANGDEY